MSELEFWWGHCLAPILLKIFFPLLTISIRKDAGKVLVSTAHTWAGAEFWRKGPQKLTLSCPLPVIYKVTEESLWTLGNSGGGWPPGTGPRVRAVERPDSSSTPEKLGFSWAPELTHLLTGWEEVAMRKKRSHGGNSGRHWACPLKAMGLPATTPKPIPEGDAGLNYDLPYQWFGPSSIPLPSRWNLGGENSRPVLKNIQGDRSGAASSGIDAWGLVFPPTWVHGQSRTRPCPSLSAGKTIPIPLSCTSRIHLQLSLQLSCIVAPHPPITLHFLPLLLTQDITKPIYPTQKL